MKILIIKCFDHYSSGWSYLSKHLKNTIEELFLGSSVEIESFPYTSVWNSSYYFYTYKNIDIKEKYDLIFVCEGKPSKKWAKNGKVIWIPCQEFLGGGPWKLIQNTENIWYSILSPSKYLFDRISDVNSKISLDHIQLWSKPFFSENNKHNNNLKLFLHFRSRNWGQEFWTKLIKRLCYNFPNFNYTLKVDNHSDLNISNINLKNINQMILGGLKDRSHYINSLSDSDIYFAPRIIEGIGLCMQEAAQLGNVLIGPDYTTYNEYFSDKNGLTIDVKEYRTDKSPIIMGEQKNVSIAEKQIPKIIDYLESIDKDRNKLEEIKEYNKEYSLIKYEEFKENLNQYIQKNTYKNSIHKKEEFSCKALHIQFCLEGGQGLISTLISTGLKKYNGVENTFYYLSDQDQEVAIESYLDRLNHEKINHEKIELPDQIKNKDFDIIFIHWSSSAERRNIDFEKWYKWIKKTHIPTVGLIYDSVKVMPDICDYYCVSSNFNMKFSPNKDKTHIAYYPIENCFFNVKESNFINYKSNSLVIGRTSRIINRKFHQAYVPIIKYINDKYSNSFFDIIGDGDDEQTLRKSLLDWKVNFNIRKGLYGCNRAKIMGSADICLYLTSEHEESFGLAVAEYLALGIPIICENKGALKETIGDGGLVCDSLHDVLNYCDKLITDVNFRKQISKKAKEKAKEYSEEKVSNQYCSMIKKILKESILKWSIIMPAYNVQNYIQTAIQSVINQRYGNWELIIINDSSNDKTQEIIESFDDSRIRNIQIENGPHSQAYCWQKGLEESKGEYLGFLDSDDFLMSNALLEMNNYYDSCLGVICAWSQNERWDENLENKIKNGLSEDPYKYENLINGMLNDPGIVVSHFLTCKKSPLKEIGGFDISIPTSADRWLALNLDLIGKLGFVNKVLHKYRFLRPGCVTLERRQDQIKTIEKLLNEALEKRNDSRRVQLIIKEDNFNYEIKINENDLSIN